VVNVICRALIDADTAEHPGVLVTVDFFQLFFGLTRLTALWQLNDKLRSLTLRGLHFYLTAMLLQYHTLSEP
jgi:hypothetical protein